MSTLSGEVDRIRRRAADLAGPFSRVARRSATIAQERAVLRMLGVDGLDRSGRPLAASLAERYCGSDPARLAHGVLLPFAVALLEYDLPPRELALEGAAGAIDLGLEAELLERPDRRAAAEELASQLLTAALARFDANRTAAREMREVLGSAEEPWLGVALNAAEVEAAARETKVLVSDGADVVQVRVPASWEFAEARRQAGLRTPDSFEAGGRRPKAGRGGRPDDKGERRRSSRLLRTDAELVPAGSQRGLAALRRAADEAAVERSCYAGLMTVTSAFAAPEQAVVAAFERIDLVEADPIREIVEDNVDPERALADHAFAHRLQARAGCHVVMGGGPLALGADVASGIPSDAHTRAGRGLALQALGVEIALADGLPADRLMLGAVPDWISGEGDATAILVQAWLRRLVFPGSRFAISGWTAEAVPGRTASLVAALVAAPVSLVVRGGFTGRVDQAAADLREAAASAAAVRTALGGDALHGPASDLALRTLRAANATLERLAAEGWGSLLVSAGSDEAERLGRTAVVERSPGSSPVARLIQG